MTPTQRVAVFIDAENIPHHYCDEIFQRAQAFGRVCARRVYGNQISWDAWARHAGAHALKHIVTHPQCLGRKNAADISLMLDAMSIAYSSQCDTICLVSNDEDFLQMVLHLREKGFNVYGIGTSCAAHNLKSALDKFITLPPQENSKLIKPHATSAMNHAPARAVAEKDTKKQRATLSSQNFSKKLQASQIQKAPIGVTPQDRRHPPMEYRAS